MKAVGLDPDVFRELIGSKGGIKYLGNLLEAGNTSREAAETIKEAVEGSKESLNKTVNKSKPKIVHGNGGTQTSILVFDSTINSEGNMEYFYRYKKLKHPISNNN